MLVFQQFHYRGEMTARTKASLSKPTHSRNAYVTTNGAKQPSTAHYSLLVSQNIQQKGERTCLKKKKHVCM